MVQIQKNIYALLRGLDVIIWVMREGNLQGFYVAE